MEDKPIHYGICPPLNSWNPVWANFHHYYHMVVVEPKYNGFLAPFKHWTPPGSKCPKIGSRMNPAEKYDVFPASPELGRLVVGQFILVFFMGVIGYLSKPKTAAWLASEADMQLSVSGNLYLVVLFVTIFFGFVTVTELMSATSHKSIRRSLVANGCFHVLISTMAVAVVVITLHQSTVMISLPVAYLMVNLALI